MDRSQIQKIISLFVLSLVLIGNISAQESDWTNYCSQREVNSFKVLDDTLYVATNGGLMVIGSQDQKPKVYLNNNGLGTNIISDIIEDAGGQKWIAANGRIIKFHPNSSEQYLFIDNNNDLINATTLFDDNDYLWVGTEDSGLVLFSKINDNGQIEESYSQFGDLNPAPTVFDINIINDSLWLATSNGLAIADKNNPLLKSPNSWSTISLSNFPEILSDSVTKTLYYQNDFYFATTRALCIIEFNLPGDTSITVLDLGSLLHINDMRIINDSLLIYYDSSDIPKISYIDNRVSSDITTSGMSSAPFTGISFNSVHWIAESDGGIYFENGSAFENYPFDGLPGNDITDITIDGNGLLYASVRFEGFSIYRDSLWETLSINPAGGTTRMMTDSLGYPWLGTRGNGVWRILDDSIANYDETNSKLIGNSDNPPFGQSYVYIAGQDNDNRYAFFACYRAVHGYPLVIADLENLDSDNSWDSVGTAQGLSNTFITSLDHTAGKIAVGTESDGIYETFYLDDPISSVKTVRHLIRSNSNLISNNIRTVKYDKYNDLWVGTNFGLSRYDFGIDRFVNVELPASVNTDITALEFDNRGNVWIGTKGGLLLMDAVDSTFTIYTSLNSQLVNDVIQEIQYDAGSGDTYVATAGGITVIPSSQGKPVYEVDQVLAFPNPFVIDDPSDRLSFNFAESGTIVIYTPAGERVIEFPVAEWDGKNQGGKDVASGVYLFTITDSEGKSAEGKFLLIRK